MPWNINGLMCFDIFNICLWKQFNFWNSYIIAVLLYFSGGKEKKNIPRFEEALIWWDTVNRDLIKQKHDFSETVWSLMFPHLFLSLSL